MHHLKSKISPFLLGTPPDLPTWKLASTTQGPHQDPPLPMGSNDGEVIDIGKYYIIKWGGRKLVVHGDIGPRGNSVLKKIYAHIGRSKFLHFYPLWSKKITSSEFDYFLDILYFYQNGKYIVKRSTFYRLKILHFLRKCFI